MNALFGSLIRSAWTRVLVGIGLSALILLTPPDKAHAIRSYIVYAGQGEIGKTGADDSGSDLDARYFRDWLDCKPDVWTWNYLRSATSGAVIYHDDLTNYADDTILARILYYSGHGFHDGFIPFFHNYASDETAVQKPVDGVWKYDLLRFDGGWDHAGGADRGYPYWWPNAVAPNYHFGLVPSSTMKDADWAVGAHWKTSSTTDTQSRWNDNVQHVFLAGCSLLNDQNSQSYLSTWDSAAAGWGRTMLGSPSRVNQICGYRIGAPGDSVDWKVVDKFFYWVERGRSIKMAWCNANEDWNASGYAVIEHATAANDHMPGWGSADPPTPGDTNLIYWYTDGTGWAQSEPLDVVAASSPIERAAQAVKRAFEVPSAHAVDRAIQTVPILEVRAEEWDEARIVRDVLGRSARLDEATSLVKSYRYDDRFVDFYASGAVRVDLGDCQPSAVSVTASEAVRIAQEHVESYGGIPSDATTPTVRAIMFKTMGRGCEDFVDPRIAGYHVEWQRVINGIPVDGPGGDRIRVTVGNGGVLKYFRLWRPVVGTRGFAQLQNQASVRDSIRRGLSGLPSETVVDAVVPAYYAPSFESASMTMRPAWKASMNGGSDIRMFEAESSEPPAVQP